MVDLKPVIAKNIIDLRKKTNWTQTELARRLNYSDKAVSKWERAESVPDVIVLKHIANLFQVPLDYLLESEHTKNEEAVDVSKLKKRNRLIISLLSASLVLLIATIMFVIMGMHEQPIIQPIWMVYIYAFPIACIVLLVFNSMWGKRVVNFLIITMLVWSILLALYLSFDVHNIWLIFMVGIPAQIIILLWGRLKFRRKS